MKEIELTQGYVALVDDEDFDWLSDYTWTWSTGRAIRMTSRKQPPRRQIQMHREIMGVGQSSRPYVDHINGNSLDNRRANLRLASPLQNTWNMRRHHDGTSKFKGVRWDKSRGLWSAGISVNWHFINLGRFSCELDAAKAYDAAATKYHGEFARTNFSGN